MLFASSRRLLLPTLRTIYGNNRNSYSKMQDTPTPTLSAPKFHALSESIYISRPSDRTSPALLPSVRPLSTKIVPSHIVIFGWMDAPLRLVTKYAVPYTILFPSSNVLIKLSDGRSYLSSERKRISSLQPLANAVSDGTGVVIHSFSDGGANNLSLFLPLLKGTKAYSLIMDSSPGRSSPSSGAKALTMPLSHRPIFRTFVRFIVFLGLYLLKLWTALKGSLSRGERMRQRLNALKTWEMVTLQEKSYPPRMYLYTRADKLIPWRFVEEHAHDLASLKGCKPRLVEVERNPIKLEGDMNVELRRWEKAPHCGIGRYDFNGYWEAVIQFYLHVLGEQ